MGLSIPSAPSPSHEIPKSQELEGVQSPPVQVAAKKIKLISKQFVATVLVCGMAFLIYDWQERWKSTQQKVDETERQRLVADEDQRQRQEAKSKSQASVKVAEAERPRQEALATARRGAAATRGGSSATGRNGSSGTTASCRPSCNGGKKKAISGRSS